MNDPTPISSNTSVSYSLIAGCKPGGIWNSACGTDGGHNLTDSDPLFRLSSADDLGLRPGSPAIDVGNNTYVSGVATDYEGKQRIYNGIVDLGAYENYYRSFLPFFVK